MILLTTNLNSEHSRAGGVALAMLVCAAIAFIEAPAARVKAGQLPGPSSSAAETVERKRDAAGVIKGPLPDPFLVDQDGLRVRFHSELLRGRIVAINFVYTSCTAYCAMQAASFSRLQSLLERKKADQRLLLISLTTDPQTDTPQRLKSWAERFGRKPGWTLLTGVPRDVEQVLLALTGDVGGGGMHSPIVLIGDPDRGSWIRANALSEEDRLAAMIESIAKRGSE
jgi:protein SCO1/2